MYIYPTKLNKQHNMKKIVFFLAMLASCMIHSAAQSATDSITITGDGFWKKTQILQNDQPLNNQQLTTILSTNPDALTQYKKAKSTAIISTILSGTGGFLIGWQLGNSISGADVNASMIIAGGALIGIGIPIAIKSQNGFKKCIETYNSGLPSASLHPKAELRLGFTSNGIGLALKF
jgi:hypothetical protein